MESPHTIDEAPPGNPAALRLPEKLRYEICRTIRDSTGGYNVNAKRDLSRLARTCRRYSKPALDILWERMEKLEPLVKLIAPPLLDCGLKTEQAVAVTESKRSIFSVDRIAIGWLSKILGRRRLRSESKPPPAQIVDWTRFDQYALRIRSLRYDSYQDVEPSMICRLAGSKTHPLLPLLEELVWGPRDSSATPALSAFLSRSLRKLSIGIASDTQAYIALECILNTLPDKVPALESISLSFGGARVSSGSLQFLLRMECLRSLALTDAIEEDTFRALSALENITSVALSLPNLAITDDVSQWPQFPCLEELSVADTLMPVLSTIVRRLSTVRLSQFKYRTSSGAYPMDLHALCVALSIFSETLTSVRISCIVIPDEDFPTASALVPLLELRELTRFTFNTPAVPLRLTDGDVEKLTSAWLKVQEIDMTCRGLTFRSLISFASHCRRLESLRLSEVDVASAGGLDVQHIPSVLQHPLECLDISCTRVKDARRLARVLDRLFPDLEAIDVVPAEVELCIFDLQMARNSQR